MKKIIKVLLPLIVSCFATQHAYGQIAYRVDPTPVMTTSGTCQLGQQCPALLVPGATVTVCSYPSCAAPVTTYTDGTAATACPIYAPVTVPGSLSCTQTTGPQGQFGFWLTQGTFMYQITLPNGQRYGPFAFAFTSGILVSGVSSFNTRTGAVTMQPGDVAAVQTAVVVKQNSTNLNGGYINLPPITYNPYDSPTPCFDVYGNPVQQPLPTPGYPSTFGPNDLLLWNSTSPVMPANGSCGAPLPVNLIYGINTNGYFYARAGLATDFEAFNSIQTLNGGVTGVSWTSGKYYGAGTVTTTGPLAVGAYLGGYTNVGHSAGPPAAGTIATVTNPFIAGQSVTPGTLYFDDAKGCLQVSNGTTYLNASAPCITGGGGTPGGPTSSVQYNNSGVLAGSGNFLWSNSNAVLQICPTLTGACSIVSGINAPAFSSENTGTAVAYTDLLGNFTITGAGIGNFQNLNMQNGWTAGAGAWSLTSGGALTVSSCSGCGGSSGAPNIVVSHTFSGTQELAYVHSLNTLSPVYDCFDHTTGLGLAPGVNRTTSPTLTTTYITATNEVVDCAFNNSTGGSSGGTPANPTNGIQFNNSGAFGATSNLLWNNTIQVLTVTGGVTSGINAPVFSSSNTGTNVAFTDGSGNFTITGDGQGNFQNVVVTATFNSLATGSTSAIQQQSGTFTITGAGNAAFQSLALHNGLTVDSGLYGLDGSGVLTVASCSGCGGSGSPGSPPNGVQYNNSGAFGATSNFLWNNSIQVLTIAGSTTSGLNAPVFSSTNTGTAVALTDGTGNFTVLGNGNAAFQALSLQNGWTAGAGAYSLTAGGLLTVSSCVGCGGSVASPSNGVQYNNSGAFGATSNFLWNNGIQVLTIAGSVTAGVNAPVFSSSNTSTAVAFTTGAGTFTILGNGNAAFQALALQNGMTAGGGLYGLTAGGALTVSSCTGCSAGGGVTSFNSRTGAVTLSLADVTSATGNVLNTAGNVQFSTVATTGVINGGSFQTNTGSFTVNSGGALGAQSIAVGSGSPFNVNTSGNMSTNGTLSGTHMQNLGSGDNPNFRAVSAGTNNGSSATSGGGATFSNVGGTVAVFTFDTGGVCGIGTGEPAPGIACASDFRLKKNITSINLALPSVMALRPVTYDWKNNGNHEVGFVAQEVRTVLPQLVTEFDIVPTSDITDGKLLMLSQEGMVPWLVKAIQEMQQEIDALKASDLRSVRLKARQ